MLRWGHEYVAKSLQYYEERHRDQQVQLLKKRAAKLGLQSSTRRCLTSFERVSGEAEKEPLGILCGRLLRLVASKGQEKEDIAGSPLLGAQRDNRIDTCGTTHRRKHCGEQRETKRRKTEQIPEGIKRRIQAQPGVDTDHRLCNERRQHCTRAHSSGQGGQVLPQQQ